MRHIRLFVSSTFRDLQRERDILVRRVFPQLRALCEARGVTFTEVDLRWGLTEEDSEEGRIIPLCLGEIDLCADFFIAIIGRSYGSLAGSLITQPEARAQLLARYPWITEDLLEHKSVTELEILHAVNYRNPPPKAFFYLIEPLEPPQQIGTPPQNEEELAALRMLRLNIKQRFSASTSSYTNPEELASCVEHDLKSLIDALYPPDVLPNRLEEERTTYRRFAERVSERYFGQTDNFTALNQHITGSGPPLVVSGPPGIGKSALLAAWLLAREGSRTLCQITSNERAGIDNLSSELRKREKVQEPLLVLQHIPKPSTSWRSLLQYWWTSKSKSTVAPTTLAMFVGATVASTNWESLLRHLLDELKSLFQLPLALNVSPVDLPGAFADALFLLAARRQHIVILIDGLDQLAESERAHELWWLPQHVPPPIRLVLSTSGGRTAEVLRRRGWSFLELSSLDSDARGLLTIAYLQAYRKELSEQELKPIVEAEQTGTPLFLTLLLDEMRVFGYYGSRLVEHTQHCLTAVSLQQLYAIVLTRLEEDCASYDRGLVGRALSLLYVSRFGLSENELLVLLGKRGTPLAAAHWSPILLGLGSSLRFRSGLLSISHEALRDAVAERYLSRDGDQRDVRQMLVRYFATQPVSKRLVEELPWQLAALGAWEELAALLGRPAFLAVAWYAHEQEIRTYWDHIELATPIRRDAIYRAFVTEPVLPATSVALACRLLHTAGHLSLALQVAQVVERQARSACDEEMLQEALDEQIALYNALGNYEAALQVLDEQVRRSDVDGREIALAVCLNNFGATLLTLQRYGEALDALGRGEEICRSLNNWVGLSDNLGNQAQAYVALGRLKTAIPLLQEQQQLASRLGVTQTIADSLDRQGVVHRRLGQFQQASACHREAVSLHQQLQNLRGLQRCLGQLASIYKELGQYDDAADLLRERIAICQQIEDKSALTHTLIQFASLYALSYGPPLYYKARELLDRAVDLVNQQPDEQLSRQIDEINRIISGVVSIGPRESR